LIVYTRNLEKVEAPSTDWFYNQTECINGTVGTECANTMEVYFHLQDIGVTGMTKLGRRTKSTMGISSQVRHWENTGLNQSLIHTHTHTPFPHSNTNSFICPSST